MGIWTSMGRENHARGKHEGKEELVVLQINERFGSVPSQITERIDELTAEQLNALGVALLSFASVADVEIWLTEKARQ